MSSQKNPKLEIRNKFGNVAGLVDAEDGTISARYEYDPYGRCVRATGEMLERNPYRFSTKPQDEESGLYYYGYRYYNPSTGRWLSRDPIGEKGGKNLYAFVDNNCIGAIDLLGAWRESVHRDATIGWAFDAGFNVTYSAHIGFFNIATDSGCTSWAPWPFGQQDRHLRYTRNGRDSRDWWYDFEAALAGDHLRRGDQTRNPSECVEAARHFGQALHSRQDRSSHRPWPSGPPFMDWQPLTAHPGWWDDYFGELDEGPHVSDYCRNVMLR